MTRTTRAATAALLMAAASACSRRAEPDAYGNVEAVEVVVGAEAAGRLVTYTVTEGQQLAAGAIVGTIDPTTLSLQRDQLQAQQTATASRGDEIAQQMDGLEAQRGALIAQRAAAVAQRDALAAQKEIARRAFDRTNRLFAAQAATAQQLDQAEKDDRVLQDQIRAQEEQIKAQDRQIAASTRQIDAARAQQQTVKHQVASVEAQVSEASERIRKSQVTTPAAGTVLTTYVRAGEFVQIGQPLFRMANLDAVDVRAYVSEPQLSAVRLGQDATVAVDAGKGVQAVHGSVIWISSQAEFTPTPIQTRDERGNLVYAIKIRVPNANGLLKIGMPVDVQFGAAGAPR